MLTGTPVVPLLVLPRAGVNFLAESAPESRNEFAFKISQIFRGEGITPPDTGMTPGQPLREVTTPSRTNPEHSPFESALGPWCWDTNCDAVRRLVFPTV